MRFLCSLLLVLSVSVSGMAVAAIAPIPVEKLNQIAADIVTGIVKSADISVSGGPLDSRWNVRMELEILEVEKPDGTLSVGDSVMIDFWTVRRMSSPGPQGMDFVPAVGSRARFWFSREVNGSPGVIYPNGIEILHGDPLMNFQEYENSRRARWLGWGILTVAAAGGVVWFCLWKNKTPRGTGA